jgi:pimeloyl-ACP methyl ester carboxylesterase
MTESTKQVETRHGLVQLFDRGEGSTILFLHCSEGLEASIPFLNRLAVRNRVIATAHPGFGRSELPTHFREVGDLAYFYLDFLQAFELRNVVLAGVSFGAWIAAEIAVRCTACLSRLVLIDSLGIRVSTIETDVEIQDVFTLPQDEIDRMSFVTPSKWRRGYDSYSDDELFVLARNREALSLYAWSPYMHNPSLRHWLHRINVPTLVLWGAKDGIVSIDYGRAYAHAIEGAYFQLIPNAAHHPQIEQPEHLAKLIEDFIATPAVQRVSGAVS